MARLWVGATEVSGVDPVAIVEEVRSTIGAVVIKGAGHLGRQSLRAPVGEGAGR